MGFYPSITNKSILGFFWFIIAEVADGNCLYFKWIKKLRNLFKLTFIMVQERDLMVMEMLIIGGLKMTSKNLKNVVMH